jgi:hypothetical protein
LIWFDNGKSYNTLNYWVQYLFSNYNGTDVVLFTLPSKLSSPRGAEAKEVAIQGQDSCWASTVIDQLTVDNGSKRRFKINYTINQY